MNNFEDAAVVLIDVDGKCRHVYIFFLNIPCQNSLNCKRNGRG